MDSVIVYAQSLDPGLIQTSVGEFVIRHTYGKKELIQAVVEETDVVCLIIQQDYLDSDLKEFLIILREKIPVLLVSVITQNGMDRLPQGYRFIDSTLNEEDLKKEIRQFVSNVSSTNRRGKHRFDWPLRGYLNTQGEDWREYRVRSLSASGAFFECTERFPKPRTQGRLRILFGKCQLSVDCEIRDPRQASSNLPAGFGIRFVDLDPASADILDRIIKNALVATLTGEDTEPAVPTLTEDDAFSPNFTLI